ncbi:AAA family ATPase [Pseudomonas sp. XK-1]|uniref:AAA family ATPase n=1 Tax=Pseudomonas sp. XK-1 TaxID=3136019 RepID=UPI00311A4FB1
MLAGLFLQNYKSYSNINFIPFIEDPENKLNVFIGPNGVGKSAVLESLNCLMNGISPKEWETTAGKKKDRTSICPVFLIPKQQLPNNAKIEALSECYWNFDFSKSGNNDYTNKFLNFREKLAKTQTRESHYLIAIGKDYEGNILLTTTFHKIILDQTRRHGTSKQFVNDLFKEIVDLYSYVYIPVENKVSDILNLQAKEMQSLMDKSVIDEIRVLLDKKDYLFNEETKYKSLLDIINTELDTYIQGINSKLRDGYEFLARGTYKKTIKSNDIIETIFKEFFHIRPLTKDGKHIKSLSSGQQRLALIDVATTLLSTENKKNKNVILAIDEPENSLEPANCFEQFTRLIRISTDFKRQLLITTHWYGLLLKPTKGLLSFIEDTPNKAPEHKVFPLSNLYDQRRSFPDSIEMKSYFDLMSSMLSLLKKTDYTWIICEGTEDAKYIQSHIKKSNDKIIILPFNGSGNVKKLYEFLKVPFSDDKENSNINGKIICLVDTDEKSVMTIKDYSTSHTKKKLLFFRLSLDRDTDNSSLISVANPNGVNTVIEDVIDAEILWQALNNISDNDAKLKHFLEHYDQNTKKTHPDISRKLSFLNKKNKESYELLDDFKDYLFTTEMKSIICDEYCRINNNPKNLTWMSELISHID